MKTPVSPIDIFVSYAHADECWVTEGSPCGLLPWLENQLKNDAVRFWWDHGIRAGDDFTRTINQKIDSVQIVVLLISDDFAGSDYIINNELPRIRSRYDAGEILVIPILISTISRLNRDRLRWVVGIQMLPNDQRGLNVIVNTESWATTRAQILDEIYHRICHFRSSTPNETGKDLDESDGDKRAPLADRKRNQTQHQQSSAKSAKPARANWMVFVAGISLFCVISWAAMKLANDSGGLPDRSSEQAKPGEDSKAMNRLTAKPNEESSQHATPHRLPASVKHGAGINIQATKEKPFVNSLEMRFVPVMLTGEVSARKRVLFCIWETRVQDYRKYAAITSGVNEEWMSPGFKQDGDHPVVNVSWDDSVAFCAWLTEKERSEGTISNTDTYRLPTDYEWSCAVGIGEREDATEIPYLKDGRITDAFPWGKRWPPPHGVANYGSILNVDGWVNTAPVGRFPAGDNGLRDLGGNAWEWCEDKAKKDESWRVSRGASWRSNGKDKLNSSGRLANDSDLRTSDFGFRCVLETTTPRPPSSGKTGDADAK